MSGAQSRRGWLNLVLIALVLGLGGMAWWFTQQPVNGPQTLWSGDPARIQLLTLERRPDLNPVQKLRFEQRDGQWWMVAPHPVAANTIRLRQLFTLLDETVAADYDAAGRDLIQYELQPGHVTLRFDQQQFVLGAVNSVSRNRYVLHDNRIKLVPETIYGSAVSDWVNFVDLKLLPAAEKLTAVTLPESYPFDPSLLPLWQRASAIRLEPLPEKAAQQAQGTIVLTLEQGEPVKFMILGTGDELVLGQQERGVSYFIPAAQAAELLPGYPTEAENSD
ncbi:MAG: hypothetical protein R3E95_01830 [Thiolinea sp.]